MTKKQLIDDLKKVTAVDLPKLEQAGVMTRIGVGSVV